MAYNGFVKRKFQYKPKDPRQLDPKNKFIKGALRHVYYFDIETDVGDYYQKTGETRTWLACLIDRESKLTDNNIFFNNMNDALQYMYKLAEKEPICVYVYNLMFEWSFIQPFMEHDKYIFKEDIKPSDSHCYSVMCNSTMRDVWEAEIKNNEKDNTIYFKDACKIFSCSLKVLAKSFGLETQKGEIDYKKDRHNFDYVATPEEKEYCFNDCHILVEIGEVMLAERDEYYWQSLSAATYATWHLLKKGFGHFKKSKNVEAYRDIYPQLTDKREIRYLRGDERKAGNVFRGEIEGGITYANPKYQYGKVYDVIHIDMHQAHPSSAFLNSFPYGVGVYRTTDEITSDYELFKNIKNANFCILVHCRITYFGYKLPVRVEDIQPETYSENLGVTKEVAVWAEELMLMEESYNNFSIEFIDGYIYQCQMLPWRHFYNENFEKRKEAKKNKIEYLVTLYKLFNNSTYGKMIEKGGYSIYIPYYDQEGNLCTKEIKNESDYFSEFGRFAYLPVGTRIAMWTRIRLISTALKFGVDNFIYADTDSLFLRRTPEVLEKLKDPYIINMKDELGGWGIEHDHIDWMMAACPKRYEYSFNGEVTKVTAGVRNVTDNNIIHDIIKITVFRRTKYNPENPERGGYAPVEEIKEINVDKKYQEIFKRNQNREFK